MKVLSMKNVYILLLSVVCAGIVSPLQAQKGKQTSAQPKGYAEIVIAAKRKANQEQKSTPGVQSAPAKQAQGSSLAELDEAITKEYPLESALLGAYIGGNYCTLLAQTNCEQEKIAATKALDLISDKSFYQNAIDQVSKNSQLSTYEQAKEYLRLAQEIVSIYQLQQQLTWLKYEAVEAAFKDMAKVKGYDIVKNQARLTELKSLLNTNLQLIYQGNKNALQNARKALQLKREILLDNPALLMDKLLVGRYKIGNKARSCNATSLGTQGNNWSGQTSAPQNIFNAEIAELSNLKGNIQSRTIFKPDTKTSVPDLRLHWDANRLLFSMVEKNDHHWQVFEIGTDGKNLKQLTTQKGEHLDFSDGCYLPNGKIVAASNVGGQGVPCVSGSDQVGNLCLIDPEKDSMRRLTFDQDNNWDPVVMHNGRVMYVRWEYTDLTHYFSRIVMHMNPDGTEQRSLYGSGSVFPTSTYDVQPLPDHPTRFVGIISGHHGTVRSGRLIIFDPAISRKEEKGMVQELPYRNRPIIPLVKDQMVDDVWPQFLKPQPLTNDYFIVTAKLDPKGLWGLYLVDVFDNMTLIAEYENEGLIYGIPMVKRKTPPAIPEKVKESSKQSTVFIQDIYEGEGLQGVPRGTVKELRVFAYEYAYLKTWSDHVAQGIQSGWDLKRLLGTVPVEEDGSVMFTIPANTPISLQPLDKDGAAIQWMRSWLTGMPDETVSCVGCHEDQNSIPVPKRAKASMKKPQTLKPAEGGIHSYNFDMDVQPILDRNCIACHTDKKGQLDFTRGKKDDMGFGLSYLNLHPYIHRQGPEAGMKVLYPYEYHASVSPLVQILKKGHYGVKLTEKEWKKLYNWIDFNAPDKGYFNYDGKDDVHQYDQYERRIRLNEKFANNISADWKKEMKQYADYLKSQPQAETVTPNYTEPKYKEVKVKGFPFDGGAKVGNSQEKRVIELVPGVKITFVKIPAGQFIMGKNMKNSDVSPAHKATIGKSFWMSEKEITNREYNVFFPEHSSRFVDQQWKDHVTEGYIAHKPEQPVIRVSYNDAMSFCKKLSDKSKLNITLPTEEQWEWSCRAGSDADFWYGDINTDFSAYENMADKQMNKMAVSGVDPQPMKTDDKWYKYYAFHPKIESVDDGNMIMATPGSYKPNPFELYDMHGNVAEWTRSDYLPYPIKKGKAQTSDTKVVRGGSWKDHPKLATSYARRHYLPYQKVHNVGFRIIIED